MTDDARAMPFNLEAEQALLGCLMFEASAYPHVRGVLGPDSFHEPFHGRLYAAVVRQIEEGRVAEPTLLVESLRADPAFQQLGGLGYLADLVDRAPPVTRARHYAELLADLAIRRALIRLGQEMAQTAPGADHSGYEAAITARQAVESLVQGAASEDASFVSASASASTRLERLRQEAAEGRPRGLQTGVRAVDARLGGLLPGSLVVVAGRPGMGKTALAGNILYGAAVANPDRLFAGFSVEMDHHQLSDRALSRLTADTDAPVPFAAMARSQVSPMDLDRLERVQARIPSNLLLRDTGGLGLSDVQRAVWALGRRGRLGAVVIDYLQLMRRPDMRGRNEASVIAEITSGLKQLARDAGITIVLLSQLSRQVESRDDKRPQLSDLRESGAIEQDADAVIFPFREVYYLERAEPSEAQVKRNPDARIEWEGEVARLKWRMDVIVAKNRHGNVGTTPQRYRAAYDAIDNWEAPR